MTSTSCGRWPGGPKSRRTRCSPRSRPPPEPARAGQPPRARIGRPLVDTNNLGATRMLRAFEPILRPGGRLLVVASAFGSLRRLPPQLHERFDTDAMTLTMSTQRCWGGATPSWEGRDMHAAQTPAEGAVAPLRLAVDGAAHRSFYGELVQLGRVIAWR